MRPGPRKGNNIKRVTKVTGWLKSAIALLCVAAILFAPVFRLTALADDFDYSGMIDPFTGEPMSESGAVVPGSENSVSNRRMITNSIYYDFSQGMFAYPVNNGLVDVCASVCDGMIVSEPVTVNVPDSISLFGYYNGDPLDIPYGEFRELGEYTFMIRDGSTDTHLFSFTIVGSTTGAITGYKMPTYFRIENVALDGETVPFSSGYVELEQEGYYEIDYRCEVTEIPYRLHVTIDHTPPEVVFSGIGEDGKARGPVSWETSESNLSVVIYKDGDRFSNASSSNPNRLTQSGNYEVYIIDEAGNVTSEQFTLMIYLDRNGFVFVGIIVALIAGLIGYLIWQRKKLKVR